VADVFLGTGQGHNSIYLYFNSLAKQKVTLFKFILAVTKIVGLLLCHPVFHVVVTGS
jgi:hypothetical protein